MAKAWFVKNNDLKEGPYSWAQLAEMAASGKIGPEEEVNFEGLSAWTRAGEVEGLVFLSASEPPPQAGPSPAQPPALFQGAAPPTSSPLHATNNHAVLPPAVNPGAPFYNAPAQGSLFPSGAYPASAGQQNKPQWVIGLSIAAVLIVVSAVLFMFLRPGDENSASPPDNTTLTGGTDVNVTPPPGAAPPAGTDQNPPAATPPPGAAPPAGTDQNPPAATPPGGTDSGSNLPQDQRLFAESGYGFSMSYPQGWTYSLLDEDYVQFRGPAATDLYYCFADVIKYTSTRIGGAYLDLEDAYYSLEQYYNSRDGWMSYDSETYVNFGGIEYYTVIAEAYYQDLGMDYIELILLIERDQDNYYLLSYYAPEYMFDDYLDLFLDEMASSFRFIAYN